MVGSATLAIAPSSTAKRQAERDGQDRPIALRKWNAVVRGKMAVDGVG